MKKFSKGIKGPRNLWDGDTRVRRVFLIFPKTYYKNGTKETRWFEWAWIKEEYRTSIANFGMEAFYWVFLCFEDNPELQHKSLFQPE